MASGEWRVPTEMPLRVARYALLAIGSQGVHTGRQVVVARWVLASETPLHPGEAWIPACC